MPILKNQRWELFAQEIAKGETATKAYETAGFRPSRKNASRLRAREDVGARVHELQLATAHSAEITIQSICRELDEAVVVAKSRGQANAMVSASALRAKLAGLGVEKIEVTSINDQFEAAESLEDVAVAIARTKGYELSSEERTAFTKILREWFEMTDQFLAGCKARPIQAVISDEERMRAARRRLGLPRPDNAGVYRSPMDEAAVSGDGRQPRCLRHRRPASST